MTTMTARERVALARSNDRRTQSMSALDRAAYSALSAAQSAGVRTLLAVHSASEFTLLLLLPGTFRPTNTAPPMVHRVFSE